MEFLFSIGFQKQLKKLAKKHPSLRHDIEILQNILQVSPERKGKHSNLIIEKGIVRIRKIRLKCQFTKSKDFRVIYSYNTKKKEIEMIEFLEIYTKNKQENHNPKIIDAYLKNINV